MRLLALALLAAVAGCDSTTDLKRLDVSGLSHDPAEVVGTWDLISGMTPGEPGPAVPYAASGVTYTFRADGTAEITRRDQPTEATTWSVPDPDRPTLLIGDGDEHFGVDGDRLYFDDRPLDGGLLEFARR